jgi:hypothetical protein
MAEDARFEDGDESPVNIGALDAEDLRIISALTQDGIFTNSDMSWSPKKRRFAILINRARWERDDKLPERVRSIVIIDHVLNISSQAIDRSDTTLVNSLLTITWKDGCDGAGQLLLTLAGNKAIRLTCEALEVGLQDVTRPYLAASGRLPRH